MKRVVIYARVSTEHEAQISALENQIQYYDEILLRHKDWVLVERYIDEGISGTSINKRQNFLRMMEDAKRGMFDLVVTREVSRFARNIVDTLQQTRILKSYGVEVWFTEDNIWTFNDEDGELRLSIMATLAQNESKKISQRVKAGQMISFKNGVLYGNGNILGYDRVDGKMVVNKEQAKAVKRIFQLYLEGNGVRKIQNTMELEHFKTATGQTKWQSGCIHKTLKNPFYCGRIEYRKQYVPDYLTQKKINNHGEVEKIYVQGEHEILISPEDFDKVQQMMAARSTVGKGGKRMGKQLAKNIWVKKVRCTCNHAMNRRQSYVKKSGDVTYLFQCYDQIRTGTPTSRAKKGLSMEGVCDNNTFTEWKLIIQAEFIFKKLVDNKQAIYDLAMEMIDDLNDLDFQQVDYRERIEQNLREFDKLKEKLANLLDMCSEGDISRETYREKKALIERRLIELERLNDENKRALTEVNGDVIKQSRIDAINEFIKMEAFNKKKRIPDSIIDYYVDSIFYYRGKFQWILTPGRGNKVTQVDFNIKKNTDIRALNNKKKCLPQPTTGCYCK